MFFLGTLPTRTCWLSSICWIFWSICSDITRQPCLMSCLNITACITGGISTTIHLVKFSWHGCAAVASLGPISITRELSHYICILKSPCTACRNGSIRNNDAVTCVVSHFDFFICFYACTTQRRATYPGIGCNTLTTNRAEGM